MKKIIAIVLSAFLLPLVYAQVGPAAINAALQQHGVNPNQLTYFVTSQSTAKNNGITHVYMRQTFGGLEIYNANPSMHFDKQGKLIRFHNAFIMNPQAIVVASSNAVSSTQSIEAVALVLGVQVNVNPGKKAATGNEYVVTDRQASSHDIKTKLCYLHQNGKLVPVWNVEFYDDKTGDWWNKRVDANTGKIIDENNWTTHCNTEQFAASSLAQPTAYSFTFDDDEPMKKSGGPSYRVYPFPYESPLKTPHLLINAGDSTAASPFGWHDVNGIPGADYNITRGNNVYARADTLDTDSVNNYAPSGGPSLTFNFAVDSNSPPATYLNAAVTNLFYWNNTIHDILQRYGFDEASGNFQQLNYSHEGVGDDQVMADAQDGGGTNNANFSTPPEGATPRMQMYIWEVASSNKMFNIYTPAMIMGQYLSAAATFGNYPAPPGVTGDLQLVNDGSNTPTFGCNFPLDNLSGKIALIDRGDCFFVDKVYNAQQAGAIGAVVINNTAGAPFSMGGSGNTGDLISIPSVMINRSLGNTLKDLLAHDSTIHVTIVDSSAGPRYFDSDFDNAVIIHEYGHGVSNRLTGGSFNTGCLSNSEQGGEGWSDFFALALTARPYDNPQDGRGMSVFLRGEDSTGAGIREYRYSRNMTINPVTYDYIKTNEEVHFVGFVWCAMLYDIYWDMVDRYGFDDDIYKGNGGNNKAIQLVMDGLKLQPCEPGFVDARNAILLADSMNNNFANKNLLWAAFARRGLGYYADQGSSFSVTDGIQSFTLPPEDTTYVAELALQSLLSIYPNPSTGKIRVLLPGVTLREVSVYDMMGREVFSETAARGVENIEIDLANVGKGLFIVQVKTSQAIISRKLLLN